MRYGLIFNILGTVLRLFGLMFLIPIGGALILKEYSDILPYAVSGIITLVLGQLLLKIKTSQKDGLHLEPAEHKIIAETVYNFLR